jgi:hypothetical protein
VNQKKGQKKMKSVLNRVTGKSESLPTSFIRSLRRAERKARVGGQADYRLSLPYAADSLNRVFYYLKAVKDSELKSPDGKSS